MCEYCSVLVDCEKNSLPILPNYSNEELSNFIKKTQEHEHDNEIVVYFFGGEPSLEYNRIDNLVANLKQALSDFKLCFVLHTNGLLLNEASNELLYNLTLIMFSINYEKIPKCNLSNSYFSNVVNNAMLTKGRCGVPMIARLTITESTSIYSEIMLLSHYFDMVYWQIENKPAFCNFELFYSTYTYEIDILYKYWRDMLSTGRMLKYVPFMAALKFMLFHDRSDNEFACGYGKSMIYIQTNGMCYACSDNVEGGEHHIGSIAGGVTFPHPKLSRLKCKQCTFKKICMGRCGRMHLEFGKTHISEYCKLNQFMFSLFLNDKNFFKQIINSNPHIINELQDWKLEYTEFTP